jgi:uncharacterized protein (UPF0332 family)
MVLEKAEEFLEIAELAYNNGAYNSCVNRAYYSMRWLMIKALGRDLFNVDGLMVNCWINSILS